MFSQKDKMKGKLENMHLQERINYGYRKVIIMMLISGLLSIVVIGVLFANMVHYIENVTVADQAVKICRINVNAAARNIREMALDDDTSSYVSYEKTVEKLLKEVDSELKNLKGTGIIPDSDYEEYSSALSDWGNIGYSIIEEIKSGDKEEAVDEIMNDCTPALNKAVEIAIKLDDITDQESSRAARTTFIFAAAGIVCIIVCLIFAWTLTKKTGKKVLDTILEPLRAVEDVAKELTEGNLHSTLDYRSEDEIGRLAHSMRKSIRILGSYVDDIDRAMKLFAAGNFDVKPEVEWRGDFVGILNSFMQFEKSIGETIRGIQNVSNEVSNAADQVASSSNDLADGATNQAAVVEELTATVAGVFEQVENNSKSAKEISGRVDELGNAILESNGKMHEMVDSMNEISEASKEIDKIIATINEIASQTNLLALNASIEAARAGEAGKGFAVVANQVNSLADQSAQAAKESAMLIETSVKAVEKGMVIAGQTAAQLEDVAENSKIITEEVTNIAETLETQTTEIQQINEGIEQINDVVQTNSATSEECAAASQEMSSESENLREMIRKFKLAESEKTV
ncbi:methyl-accepting chemotaxis protein [Roseburia sp. AF22-2LB]|uniref:methyl-accepting chemotaxis protein n=1 Tax=unclassified Roseburia TaxID=2637578 RepID=UPI000E4CC772|nr:MULTISPECIES: methyl-accepting chemotaxis protein [unclassified Roseburia]RGG36174.1 methyl-accepting chemotaxis protein [Roseburia sp. AF22-8AC]RGG41436.1 methyl-accepting chemotaxis protein [Roseburia sp. AF22-2LB]